MVIQLVAAKPISVVTNEAKPNFTQIELDKMDDLCDFQM